MNYISMREEAVGNEVVPLKTCWEDKVVLPGNKLLFFSLCNFMTIIITEAFTHTA